MASSSGKLGWLSRLGAGAGGAMVMGSNPA